MTELISRRSAILRMLAAFNTTQLLAWETSRDNRAAWPAQFTKIVSGERLGDIFVDMKKSEILARLGLPCETSHFEAEDLEQTLKVFAYINKMTGRNLTAKDAYPLRPATTYLNYDRLGLSVCLVKDRVDGIHAYTGVACGYEDDAKSYFPTDRIPPGATVLTTLSDVQIKFGNPDNVDDNPYAPIPESGLTYRHGIAFSGRTDDGRLARITVMKPRAL